MSSSIIQSTQDNRISSKTICSIDLSALIDAKLDGDPDTAREATEIVDAAYSVQQRADALTARRNTQSIADLENKHVEALMLKQQLEAELATLNLRTYEFQAESGRIAGRMQQATNRLTDHLAAKKRWVEALLLPKDRLAWEAKRTEFQATINEAVKDKGDLQLEVNAHNEELATLANRIRTATADALYLFAKIERLRGSKEPIMDRATGLAG